MDSFDAVVFAAPLSSLLRGSVELYDHDKKVPVGWMPQVKYAPVSVVAAVFNKKDMPDMTQIQRIKVPASEDYMNCYEIALSHNASPGSQEEEQVLVTGYMGGPDNPRLAKKDDLSLKQKLQKDLKNLLGKTPNPVFMRSFFWHDAAAQFPEGYGNSIRALRKLEDLLPGLYFAGDYHGEQDMGSILTSADISASKILNDLIVIKHLKGKELFALWDFRGRNDLTVQHQIEQRSKKMQANKDIVYKLLEEEANQYRSAPPSKHDDASPPSKVDETQETSTPLAKQEDPPPKIFSLDEWKPKLVAWIHQLGKEKKETEEELPEMTAEERRKFLQERLRMLEKLRREEVLRQLDREKESAKHAREMAMMEVRQEQHRQRKS